VPHGDQHFLAGSALGVVAIAVLPLVDDVSVGDEDHASQWAFEELTRSQPVAFEPE
jgi:hypothetical protein